MGHNCVLYLFKTTFPGHYLYRIAEYDQPVVCWQVSPKTFIPALFGHAKDDKFIQPNHSELIYNSYAVLPQSRVLHFFLKQYVCISWQIFKHSNISPVLCRGIKILFILMVTTTPLDHNSIMIQYLSSSIMFFTLHKFLRLTHVSLRNIMIWEIWRLVLVWMR